MKIIGYEKEKESLNELVNMLLNSEEYMKKGVRIPKGAVLVGQPGVGKTRLVKGMLKDGINLVELKTIDITDENAMAFISEVFLEAKAKSPAILFIDELDKIAGQSYEFKMEDNSDASKVLLQELDNVNPSDNILVVATCNDKEALCQALLRPGRFDRIIQIDKPDYDTRKKILEAYFKDLKIEKDLDYDVVTKFTSGQTGAEIERLVNETGIYALNNKIEKITIEDIKIVENKIIFEGDEKSYLKGKEAYRVAVHEAGHAVMALRNTPESVFGVSIIPQGDAGGHVFCTNEDNGTMSVTEFEDIIKVALGGHVAERVVLGYYGVGAGSDLQRASSMVNHLCRIGCYGYEYILKHVGGNFIMSQTETDLIAEKISSKLYELDKEVEEYIKSDMDEFNEIVDQLIKEKTLHRETLLDIHKKYE